MPPKKGIKRKAAKESTAETNGDAHLTPPDRENWPGWVEMESEPVSVTRLKMLKMID